MNAAARNLRIVDSPIEVVKGSGHAPAVTLHSTPTDKERFDSFIRNQKYSDAVQLCRERLLTAKDDASRVRWVKDLSIVRLATGQYEDAYDLLISVYSIAQSLTGTLRGRYENGLARVLELLKQYVSARKHYHVAHFHHRQVGALVLCAGVDTNVGRLFAEANKPTKSHRYFDRAELIAQAYNETRLHAEILESRALAFESQNRFKEAQEAASRSVSLLFNTEHIDAFVESKATRDRIENQLIKGR